MLSNTQVEHMIAAARACAGTPYRHQGRSPGNGLDCLGLIISAVSAIGINVVNTPDYGRSPRGDVLLDALQGYPLTEVPKTDIQAGDLLVFRFNSQPQHFGLATGPDTMVHSFSVVGSVVETNIGISWLSRLTHVFRIEEVPS